jgi:UDP-2,4-diacetamido-2,4,6-trideoxy-beta-L-altropyranose hydrolase
LIKDVVARGITVQPLAADDIGEAHGMPGGWESAQEIRDAEATCAILDRSPSALVVVDSYSLGECWESAIRAGARRIVAIDDLADRSHACDLLIDQNLGRRAAHYAHLIPAGCRALIGPDYALVRPEFGALRDFSLRRRKGAGLRQLFIALGGVDQSNATGQVLAALRHSALPPECRIVVALGKNAPWVESVRDQMKGLSWATELIVGAPGLAEIMASSDLAIGAAGGSAWERCCLGLPTLIIVLAENQRLGAGALAAAHAGHYLGEPAALAQALPRALELACRPDRLADMSLAASRLVDGLGAGRVREQLEILVERP